MRRPIHSHEVELWCRSHWNPVLDSRLHPNPINGTAATEFLLRRFIEDVQKEEAFQRDITNGLTPTQAQQKALANLAPICCLYKGTMTGLYAACRFEKLAVSHPSMNDADDPEGLHHVVRFI